MSTNLYAQGLDKREANYSPLTPISFLYRSAAIFPHKTAVIDGERRFDYATLLRRCEGVAAGLRALGVGPGDCVAVLCPNTHVALEAHYAVPMAGAVLNALNIRLDAATLRYILEHGQARVLIYDTQFEAIAHEIAASMAQPPRLVAAGAASAAAAGAAPDYEALAAHAPAPKGWTRPADEWDAIALNYTSGTTGNPKGVVYHHRGAYLAAMSNALAFGMGRDAVYLWTLPMFHCNGWCFTWAVTAVGGTHVCLQKVQADAVRALIERHGVSHMCGAPVVLNLLLNEFAQRGARLPAPVQFVLGGAAPPVAVIGHARQAGFEIIHAYGLTETYGPSALCVRQADWDGLDDEALAARMARQGVANFAIDALRVADRATGQALPQDGAALGELLIRGNTVMKGYLKDPQATEQAFEGGWFHSGDLTVAHPDGYVEVKDRAKDIIISGGENISSKEIEDVLYTHPQILEAAVVAAPDDKWGEVPCAFICFKDPDQALDERALTEFCRARLAPFKTPKRFIAGELPKTATGKIRKNVLRTRLKPGD